MKTSELIGPALDWAVAKCEGHEWRCPWLLEKEGLAAWVGYERAWGNPTPAYSTDWSQGGPIIERERLTIAAEGDPKKPVWVSSLTWPREVTYEVGTAVRFCSMRGPTSLIAAMRCFVASRLGDEVDVPKELR